MPALYRIWSAASGAALADSGLVAAAGPREAAAIWLRGPARRLGSGQTYVWGEALCLVEPLHALPPGLIGVGRPALADARAVLALLTARGSLEFSAWRELARRALALGSSTFKTRLRLLRASGLVERVPDLDRHVWRPTRAA